MGLGAYPKCPECGKTLFPSQRIAREATRTIGNRLWIYREHGGFHISDGERDRTGGYQRNEQGYHDQRSDRRKRRMK